MPLGIGEIEMKEKIKWVERHPYYSAKYQRGYLIIQIIQHGRETCWELRVDTRLGGPSGSWDISHQGYSENLEWAKSYLEGLVRDNLC